MDEKIAKLKKRFPSFPVNSLIKIDHARWNRLKMLMIKGMLEYVLWLIETKVRLSGEFSDLNFSIFTWFRKKLLCKKRRVKRLQVCYKCARWTCNQRYRSIGFASTNRANKI